MPMKQEDGVPGLQEQIDPLPIHLHLILDVSPSMKTRWKQTISGLNEYVASLRKDQEDNDQPYKVTMTTFSADANKIYDEVELDTLPTFTETNLHPHGWGTALYDAIGPTVKSIKTEEPVLIVIITDGEENSSKTWDVSTLSKLMDEKQALGNYTYVYLGVAKEAWGNAAKITPLKAGSTKNIDAASYDSGTYTSLGCQTASFSHSMRSLRTAGAPLSIAKFFNDEPDEEEKITEETNK